MLIGVLVVSCVLAVGSAIPTAQQMRANVDQVTRQGWFIICILMIFSACMCLSNSASTLKTIIYYLMTLTTFLDI